MNREVWYGVALLVVAALMVFGILFFAFSAGGPP